MVGVGTWSLRRRPRTGKVTMVGFFSRKKVFRANRLTCTTRNRGRRAMRNVLRPPRGLSVSVTPSNLRRICPIATCGIAFFSITSWNRGAGGRSSGNT